MADEFRLARIPAKLPIVEKGGNVSTPFQKWWQSHCESIEQRIADISQLVSDLQEQTDRIDDAVQNIVSILVRLGLVEITADNAFELADAAILPGGTIKDDKVVTQSMVVDAATAGYYAVLGTDTTMPDVTDTTIVSVSFTKALPSPTVEPTEGSDIILTATLRMESSDDIKGLFSIYRDGGPGVGTLIDTVDWDTRLNGSIAKLSVPYAFVDVDAAAGARSYYISFERNGGGSAVTAKEGSFINALERKR